MYLKDNMQNQTTSELYTEDKKTKYSSNPNYILKSKRKSQMNNFTFARLKFLQNIFLNEYVRLDTIGVKSRTGVISD